MTHTLAKLELSKAAYDEIATKLIDAGYQHAFLEDGLIDMDGIGVAPAEEAAEPPKRAAYEWTHTGARIATNCAACAQDAGAPEGVMRGLIGALPHIAGCDGLITVVMPTIVKFLSLNLSVEPSDG
jgi:hypothetical protein